MTFNSAKLTDYILNKFGLAKDLTFEVNKYKIHLHITPAFNTLRNLMFARSFTPKEIATMILNEDNPKTMDYYFMKLLKVKVENACVSSSGSLSGNVRSSAQRVTESFGVLGRALRHSNSLERGQIYFVLDIHDNQIFPTSRSFRICSRKLLPISVSNPKAGHKKHVVYSGGYTATYTEPAELMVPKHLILYCRNAWERKGEVKPSRAKGKKAATTSEVLNNDATEEAVRVI